MEILSKKKKLWTQKLVKYGFILRYQDFSGTTAVNLFKFGVKVNFKKYILVLAKKVFFFFYSNFKSLKQVYHYFSEITGDRNLMLSKKSTFETQTWLKHDFRSFPIVSALKKTNKKKKTNTFHGSTYFLKRIFIHRIISSSIGRWILRQYL